MVCYVHLPWRVGLKGTEALKEWSRTFLRFFSYIILYSYSVKVINCPWRWFIFSPLGSFNIQSSLWYFVSSQGCGCWRVWLWQVRLYSCQGAQQGGSEPVCPGPHHHRCPQWPPGQTYWTGEDKHYYCSQRYTSTLFSLCCVMPLFLVNEAANLYIHTQSTYLFWLYPYWICLCAL